MINKESEKYKIFINQLTKRILVNPLILNYIEDIVAEYDIEFEEAKKGIIGILRNHEEEIAKICLDKNIIDFGEGLPLYIEAECAHVIDTLNSNMIGMLNEIVQGEEKRAKVLFVNEKEPPKEEHNMDEYIQNDDILIKEDDPNLIQKIIEASKSKNRIVISSGFGGLTKGDNLIPTILDEIKKRENELGKIKSRIFFRFEHSSQSKEPRLISLDKIIKDEQFLEYIIQELKKRDFSPYELFIAIYDITKNLKVTITPKDDISDIEGKRLHYILNNAYYVCAGHAIFYKEICSRLNLPCIYINLVHLQHISNYIYIKDPKYNIDGFYAVESTWEGHIEEDRDGLLKNGYGFFALTTNKIRELYYKELRYKNQGMGIADLKDFDMFLTATTPEELRQRDLNAMVNFIYNLDKKGYFELFGKEYLSRIKPSKLTDELATKIIDFFNNKVNKQIPIEKKLDAIINVKRKIFKGYTEQDYLDLKMSYFADSKFFIDEFSDINLSCEEKYNKYVSKRYQQIKENKIKEVIENNRFLDVTRIIRNMQLKIMVSSVFQINRTKVGTLLDIVGRDSNNIFSLPELICPEFQEKVVEKKKSLNLAGIQVFGSELDGVSIMLPNNKQNTIEENMRMRENALKYLYKELEIEIQIGDSENVGR